MDGVVPAGEGVLWPRGGVLLCVGAYLDLCVGGGECPGSRARVLWTASGA